MFRNLFFRSLPVYLIHTFLCNTLQATFNHSWCKCNPCGQRCPLQVELGSPATGKRINEMMLTYVVISSFMGPLALKSLFLYWKYIKIVEKDISAGKSLMHQENNFFPSSLLILIQKTWSSPLLKCFVNVLIHYSLSSPKPQKSTIQFGNLFFFFLNRFSMISFVLCFHFPGSKFDAYVKIISTLVKFNK